MKKLQYYFLLINYFKQGVKPTRDELISYLKKHDLVISERTLYRALNDLLLDYGIDIVLDYSTKTYYISSDSIIKAEITLAALKNLVPLNTLMNDLSQKKFFDKYIEITNNDTAPVPFDCLKLLIKALSKKKQVTFDWKPMNALKSEVIFFSPMFFRYYHNRWCVIGYSGDRLMSIDLDFISNIKLTENIARPYDEKTRKIYSDIVGINHTKNESQLVKLAFNSSQLDHLERFPIHQSQMIEMTSNGKIIVALKIRPNIDFKDQLLRYGSSVQVIEPEWLKNEVIHEIRKMLAYYE